MTTNRQRLLYATCMAIALATTAGCNKRDNLPPVNNPSPTSPTVPSPEVSASATASTSSASQ